jgi:hypothetical protein
MREIEKKSQQKSKAEMSKLIKEIHSEPQLSQAKL